MGIDHRTAWAPDCNWRRMVWGTAQAALRVKASGFPRARLWQGWQAVFWRKLTLAVDEQSEREVPIRERGVACGRVGIWHSGKWLRHLQAENGRSARSGVRIQRRVREPGWTGERQAEEVASERSWRGREGPGARGCGEGQSEGDARRWDSGHCIPLPASQRPRALPSMRCCMGNFMSPPKAHNFSHAMRTSDEPRLRDRLQASWQVLLAAVITEGQSQKLSEPRGAWGA